MSGLEVLGAVACTAQLLGYVLTVSTKLNEVRSKIRHAPKKLEEYNCQLKDLIAITRHVEQNPPIQTEELKNCLATVEARIRSIQEILAIFEASSKNRRRWNIISGDLLRQLDGCFRDIRTTIENIVVLIVSQNAHSHKELKDLMKEIITATTPTTTTPATSVHSSESVNSIVEYEKRKRSHLFQGLSMQHNIAVTMGNVSSPRGIMPSMVGHSFIDFEASGNKVLHLGNTGSNSEGHVFKDGTLKNNEATMLGDYSDLEQKIRHISLQQGSTLVSPP
ncbi:hypothetical protein NPX13_g26 [Xylaria arbuscula]|uniref:Fungal N-terminal domain-containing protein n=1 Tax=Xylaria arbuscula TaxID=114810 RepID=A0A9W8NPR3_9PEZI|nr:hypothetical protein NPX13_g26 [Xylaria arbuscula]